MTRSTLFFAHFTLISRALLQLDTLIDFPITDLDLGKWVVNTDVKPLRFGFFVEIWYAFVGTKELRLRSLRGFQSLWWPWWR